MDGGFVDSALSEGSAFRWRLDTRRGIFYTIRKAGKAAAGSVGEGAACRAVYARVICKKYKKHYGDWRD